MDVKQVVNVLELMEFFAEYGRPASLAEISKHFDWPRSSTFNLIGTLVRRGYLYEPRAREGYYPSTSWVPLIEKISHASPLPPELQDLLISLRDQTGETTVLAAISGMHALFIATAESTQSVRYTAPVGKVVPLHASATGRALLSQLSERERASILRRTEFERYTPTTLMSVEAVERDIELSLRRGYFDGAGGYTHDLGGVALPLNNPNRHLAVLVAGPLARVEPRREGILRIMRDNLSRHLQDPSTI